MAEEVSTIEETIQRVIEARVAAAWTTESGVPLTPIQYPAVLGLVDVNGSMLAQPSPESPWLDVAFEPVNTNVATIGASEGGLNLMSALIALTVFVPNEGKGSTLLNTYVGLAKSIFDRFNESGLRCLASGVRAKAIDGPWLKAPVITECEYYANIA